MPAKPRFRTPRSGKRRNRLDEISVVARDFLGFDLLPWQAGVLESATEYAAKSGKPYFGQAVVTVPRQSGKTFLMFALMVELALREPGSKVAFTAQTRLNAARRLADLGGLLLRAGAPMRLYRGIGNEKIEFDNGSVIEVLSPVFRGFHGDSVSLGVLDETWAIEEVVLEGLVPAMAARANSQMWAISTMGTPDSILLNRFVTQGREAVEERRKDGIYYCEFSIGSDDDPFDPEVWKKYHPALGLTVEQASIESAMETLLPSAFVRAYGNRMVDTLDAAVSWELWEGQYRSNVAIPNVGLTLAVDLGIGPDSGSVAVAWATEDGVHSELVLQRPGSFDWVAGEVDAYLGRRGIVSVVVDAVGPARAVASELEAVCERRGVDLFSPRSSDIAGACGIFFDGLRSGRFTHGPAELLDNAIRGVVLKVGLV